MYKKGLVMPAFSLQNYTPTLAAKKLTQVYNDTHPSAEGGSGLF